MKKNILSLIFAFSLIIMLFIVSCTKDAGKLSATVNNFDCDTITYTKHIKPIMDNICLDCHGTQPNPNAPVLASYTQVQANASKIKATTLDPNPVPELMPQGGPPLSQSQKNLISCWLSNGMKK